MAYDGSQADNSSNAPSLSGDGRFLVYSSNATNLVAGDTNRLLDIFLYDRTTGTTELVNRGLDGASANGYTTDERISADGQWVVFTSEASNLVPDDSDGLRNVFAWNRTTKETTRLSTKEANWPDVSADGRYVTFTGYDEIGLGEVFVLDRQTGRTTQASPVTDGGWSPAISDNGRFVVFQNYDGGHLYDRRTNTATRIEGSARSLAISGNGAFVSFNSGSDLVPADTNGQTDVYVWERQTGTFTAVSVGPDGRTADGFSADARLSANGRYVTFWSTVSGLSDTDPGGWRTQAYRFDRRTGRNTLIATPTVGEDGGAEGADLSADGSVVGFMSGGDEVVAGDTNGSRDVFVTVF